MFLPSILIADAHSDYKICSGALSISINIFIRSCGVILVLKIPVSLGKLFMIFLIRTAITLPIIALMAHLLLL